MTCHTLLAHLPFLALAPMSRVAVICLFLVLLPQIMARLRLPPVVGYLLAGMLLGPGLLGVMLPEDSSTRFFSDLGKLLFMFFVGYEVNLEEFHKCRRDSMVFGSLTFLVPLLGGLMLGRAGGYEWNASLLIGSIIASHTLLAYPLLAKAGLTQSRAAVITVGGTLFTDVAAMIILAITVSIHQTGFSWGFLAAEGAELLVFVPLVLFGLSRFAAFLLRRIGSTQEARIGILLAFIIVCSEAAHLIHLEGIVGAFLAGLALKRVIPAGFDIESLELVSRTLFIPVFFVATGLLVDFGVLRDTVTSQWPLVFGLTGVLILGKWVAARLTGRFTGLDPASTSVVWSLSIPQMAATLASAVVGYQVRNAAGERLLDERFINATLFMVVVTCVIGPVLTGRFIRRLPAP
jgi:Kef-type K+ transport system membrane component KefB|uniref:cation:proton antiporter n=1 Tax=Prosthecobacter sp. TaxID=1965333 RepID=UPI003784993A